MAPEALAKSCRKVAWLDCDILFDRAERADALLDRFPIIRLFRRKDGECGPPGADTATARIFELHSQLE